MMDGIALGVPSAQSDVQGWPSWGGSTAAEELAKAQAEEGSKAKSIHHDPALLRDLRDALMNQIHQQIWAQNGGKQGLSWLCDGFSVKYGHQRGGDGKPSEQERKTYRTGSSCQLDGKRERERLSHRSRYIRRFSSHQEMQRRSDSSVDSCDTLVGSTSPLSPRTSRQLLNPTFSKPQATSTPPFLPSYTSPTFNLSPPTTKLNPFTTYSTPSQRHLYNDCAMEDDNCKALEASKGLKQSKMSKAFKFIGTPLTPSHKLVAIDEAAPSHITKASKHKAAENIDYGDDDDGDDPEANYHNWVFASSRSESRVPASNTSASTSSQLGVLHSTFSSAQDQDASRGSQYSNIHNASIRDIAGEQAAQLEERRQNRLAKQFASPAPARKASLQFLKSKTSRLFSDNAPPPSNETLQRTATLNSNTSVQSSGLGDSFTSSAPSDSRGVATSGNRTSTFDQDTYSLVVAVGFPEDASINAPSVVSEGISINHITDCAPTGLSSSCRSLEPEGIPALAAVKTSIRETLDLPPEPEKPLNTPIRTSIETEEAFRDHFLTPREAFNPSVAFEAAVSVATALPVALGRTTPRLFSRTPVLDLSVTRPKLMLAPGPAGYVSWEGIDPDKLKPFIGPLLPQQPPPNRPLPLPPAKPSHASSTVKQNRFRSNQALDMAEGKEKTNENEDDGFSLGPPFKPLPDTPKSTQQRLSGTSSKDNTSVTIEGKPKSGEKSVKTKRGSLRNKMSTLFGEAIASQSVAPRGAENTNTSTTVSVYRPLSLHSYNSEQISFSDAFENIINAVRTPTIDSQDSGRPFISFLSRDPGAPVPAPAPTSTEFGEPGRQPSTSEVVDSVVSCREAKGGKVDQEIMAAMRSAGAAGAPPLNEHPAVRNDLGLQAQSGLLDVHSAPPSITASTKDTVAPLNDALRPAPLNVNRQRPIEVVIAAHQASNSATAPVNRLTGFTTRHVATVTSVARESKTEEDVDPEYAFDRTVDVTWYRYARKDGEQDRTGFIPQLDQLFDGLSTVFRIKHSRGRETTKYDSHQARFRYFDFDGQIRFKIMEKLLEEYLPGKPVLLNFESQASPAWPQGTFATLKELVRPLKSYLRACPQLRAEVMTALLMKQSFHIIFSPYLTTKPEAIQVPTTWLFDYAYFMQDLSVEVDMTKLGFGARWEATGMSVQIQKLGDLIHVLVERLLKRCPKTNPMTSLTIYCRRYFGYRQGQNPFAGDDEFYRYPLIGGQDQGKPASFLQAHPGSKGYKSASLPPSANNPYSGHRRHHSFGFERCPFVHEGHMSIFNTFVKLAGRVWAVRMVGLSDDWVRDNHWKFWPQAEYDTISEEEKTAHIDRFTPSCDTCAAPGHAVYLDYGIRSGIHRFPPLPDSEPMVCADYHPANDIFIEVGSGKILSVVENGVEVIARAKLPSMPIKDLPTPGAPSVPVQGFNMRPSRIPMTASGASSPVLDAARKGYPNKALKLLGLPDGSGSQSEHEENRPEPSLAAALSSFQPADSRRATMEEDRVAELGAARARAGSKTPSRARALAAKKSFLGLMGSDRRNPTV